MTILRHDTKKLVRKQLERLISRVKPAEAGKTADMYTEAILAWLEATPDALSGDSYAFRDPATAGVGNQGTLLAKGQSPGGKHPGNVRAGDRIDLRQLDRNDWKWLRRTVKSMVEELRFGRRKIFLDGYILSESDRTWTNWSTSDCFFCAVLAVLGLRFGDVSVKSQKVEQELEGKLAGVLGLPMRLVADETLMWVVEKRLEWPRVAGVSSKAQLEGVAQAGTDYLVSYCSNAETDF